MRSALIIPFVCLAYLLQAQSFAHLSGQVRHAEHPEIAFLLVENYVTGQSQRIKAALNAEGHFDIQLPLLRPSEVRLQYGEQDKRLFIEPGDDLIIDFDAQHFAWSFSFSGEGSLHNDFLKLQDAQFGQYSDNYLLYEIAQRDWKGFQGYMKLQRDDRWAFLRSQWKSDFSQAFADYCYAEIDYWWARQLLRYRYEHQTANNLQPVPMAMKKGDFAFLGELVVNNAEALQSGEYRRFLQAYMAYRAEYGRSAYSGKDYVALAEMRLRAKPGPDQGVVGTLRKGELMAYLDEQSGPRSSIRINGEERSGMWLRVRSSSGREGWVFGGGVESSLPKAKSALQKWSEREALGYAGGYLTGEVLQIAVATKIYASVEQKDGQFSAVDVQAFANLLGQNLQAESPLGEVKESLEALAPALKVEEEESPKVRISGTVINPTFYTVVVKTYRDMVSLEENEYLLTLDAANNFGIELPWARPGTLRLLYGEKEFEMFVEPGDDLKLRFEGEFPLWSLEISGKGAERNMFLKKMATEFGRYTSNYIYYEIVNRNAQAYRQYMDELRERKWRFFHASSEAEKSRFGEAFGKYLSAEIDYNWAYELLRYHWEHPAANDLSAKEQIYAGFYSFLNEVQPSNDEAALVSKQYVYFTNLYLKLRRENLAPDILNQISRTALVSLVAGLRVRGEPDGEPVLTELGEGDKMQYLFQRSAKESTYRIRGKDLTKPWYKVRTPNGYTGWVFGGAVEFDYGDEKRPRSNATRSISRTEQVTETKAIATVASLRIRETPENSRAVAILAEGEEMLYLGTATESVYTFTLRGTTHTEPFYKVRTKDGKIGWAFGGGIELKRSTYERTVTEEVPAESTPYNSAETFLQGRAQQRAIAADIFWRIRNTGGQNMSDEVEGFIRSNPYDDYDDVIQSAYFEALRKSDKPAFVYKPYVTIGDQRPEREGRDPVRTAPVETASNSDNNSADPVENQQGPENTGRTGETGGSGTSGSTASSSSSNALADAGSTADSTATSDIADTAPAVLSLRLRSMSLLRALQAKMAAQKILLAEKAKEAEAIAKAEADKKAKEAEAIAKAEADKKAKEAEAIAKAEADKKAKEAEAIAKAEADKKAKEAEVAAADKRFYNFPSSAAKSVAAAPALPTRIQWIPPRTLAPSIIRPEAPVAESKATFGAKQLQSGLLTALTSKAPEQTAQQPEDNNNNAFQLDPALVAELDAIVQSTTVTTRQEVPVVREEFTEESLLDLDAAPIDRPMFATKVRGKIAGYDGRATKLNLYKDPITFKEISQQVEVAADGSFSVELMLPEAVTGKLIYGNQHIELYLEPSDDLSISFDARNFLESVGFEGKGAVHNSFMRDIRSRFRRQDGEAQRRVEYNSAKEYEQFMRAAYLQKRDFLKGYPQRGQFSNTFAQFAQADVDYWYGHNMLNYPWEHPLYKNMDSPMQVPSDYYAFLKDLPLQQEGAWRNPYYTYFLDIYMDNKEMETQEGKNRVQLADELLNGEIAYYFKAKQYTIACRRGKADQMAAEIVRFVNECPYPSFIEAIRFAYNDSRGLRKGMKAPNFVLSDVDGRRVSLEDFAGKVVYMDFWATWCTPCIDEMRKSQRLSGRFEGQDIVFVYISVEATESAWRNYVLANHLRGVHLYTVGETQSEVAKLYEVRRLPSYVMIDKSGRIARIGNKAPTEAVMVEEINRMLAN